jgi:hypothetical protein
LPTGRTARADGRAGPTRSRRRTLPQPELHVLLAEDALGHWLARPASAPFDAGDGACRNAFLHGSLAPDMGLFPGGALFVSHCVHRGGATEVGRRLVAAARSPVERAFAWGWLAHVLADARIHPLINEGGVALLEQERATVDIADCLVAHIRVELGVEGWYTAQRNGRRRTRLVHVFDRAGIDRLAGTLGAVYGVGFDAREILAAHRNVTRFATLCSQLAELLAHDLALAGEDAMPARADFMRLPGARRVASAVVARTSPLFAFLNPVRPEPWLLERIDAEIRAFAATLDELVHGGLASFPDYDLNTGRRLLHVPRVAERPRVA